MNKREFLRTGIAGAVGLVSIPAYSGSSVSTKVHHQFKQFSLPYELDAMEPFISKDVMQRLYNTELSESTYRLNDIVRKHTIQEETARDILYSASKNSYEVSERASRYFNQKLFLKMLSPQSSGPSGNLAIAIQDQFGTPENLRDILASEVSSINGPAYVWLISKKRKLSVVTTGSQETPFMDTLPDTKQGHPILNLMIRNDVSGNLNSIKREKYTLGFWQHINWERANKRFEARG